LSDYPGKSRVITASCHILSYS